VCERERETETETRAQRHTQRENLPGYRGYRSHWMVVPTKRPMKVANQPLRLIRKDQIPSNVLDAWG
jgi:hypothetical protein